MERSQASFHVPITAAATPIAGTPHPEPTPERLATIAGRVLSDLIALTESRTVSPDRIEAAGIPPVSVLREEMHRREIAGSDVAA